MIGKGQISWIILLFLVSPREVSSGWAGEDPSLEFFSAFTPPVSHVGLHLVRPSSFALTDRIMASSDLAADLTGSPNLIWTWSLWRRDEKAAAVELGLGSHSGFLSASLVPLSVDAVTKPFVLIGGIGSVQVTPGWTLSIGGRYTWHSKGFGIGSAAPQPGFHQWLTRASVIGRLGADGALFLESGVSILPLRPTENLLPAGFPDGGPALKVGLWYAHAFDHLRIMAGVQKSPLWLRWANEPPRWPVVPSLEIWWDIIPP